MKTMLSTAVLSLGSALTFAQISPSLSNRGSELQIGYSRQTFKMRDLGASPMLYVANLDGVHVSYTRLTQQNQWQARVQVGLGDLIPPGLGIRSVKFAQEQAQPLWLVPTLYRGQLELNYRRRIGHTGNRTSWLGVGLHELIGYADGLALNTWAFNSAALRLTYQKRLLIGKRHTLIIDAALPMLGALSRMPYSNVVSEPNRTEIRSFFRGTRLTTLNRYINPEVEVNYHFAFSRHVGFGIGYRYNYLYYTNPQLIRTADHSFQASIVYKCQPPIQ
ncbi:hypothetical protein GCM10028819_09600 [Spirosoma humi]